MNDLIVQDEPVGVMIDPIKDIKTGEKVAQALIQLVKRHNWTTNIQGHDYLQVEAWQTVGKFYGLTARTTDSEYVEYGEAKGFEAKAEILDKNGLVVGGATALCLNDERNWKGKPLYQLKSMAQTRAVSKAYRIILSWVVVLAGFKPTPAEEMGEVVARPATIKPDTDPDWIKQGDGDTKTTTTPLSEKQQKAIKMLQTQGKIDKNIHTTGMSMEEASKLLSSVWGNK